MATATRTQVVGILLAALLYNRRGVYAGCFTGAFQDETWISAGCTIPKPKDAALQCLASKNLLFIGDSTIRHIFQILCGHLKLHVRHHPCDISMGWGCHGCMRGCRTPAFVGWHMQRADWQDAYATTGSGTQFTFTWKPEMLTADDVIFLKRFTEAEEVAVDAVIVHKSAHEVLDWQQQLKPINYTLENFEHEMSARAQILADSLKERFPASTLFWRDAYFNGNDAEFEGINNKLEGIIKAHFIQHGFHILPGHHVSKASSKEYYNNDGLHPHDSVSDVMISMVAGVLCSDDTNLMD